MRPGKNSTRQNLVAVAASDNKAMAKLANPTLTAMFDVLPLISKWSLDSRSGKIHGLNSISSVAARALTELARLWFDGNEKAAKKLHGLLISALSDFDELCHDPYRARPLESIAKKKTIWPGFLTCDADIRDRNEALVRRLKLGCESGLNYSGRQWTRKTPETAVALKLWGIVKVHREAWLRRKHNARIIRDYWTKRNKELGRPVNFRPPLPPVVVDAKRAAQIERSKQAIKLARKLPSLSRANYKDWFTAALPEFINLYGEDFENRKLFAAYWKNKAFKDELKARALIRREIKSKIRQAFRSIAPKSTM